MAHWCWIGLETNLSRRILNLKKQRNLFKSCRSVFSFYSTGWCQHSTTHPPSLPQFSTSFSHFILDGLQWWWWLIRCAVFCFHCFLRLHVSLKVWIFLHFLKQIPCLYHFHHIKASNINTRQQHTNHSLIWVFDKFWVVSSTVYRYPLKEWSGSPRNSLLQAFLVKS